MRQGPKGDGSAASALDATAAPKLETYGVTASDAARSEHTAGLSPRTTAGLTRSHAAQRVSHARSVPALTSWRPSSGLSSIERYGRFEILGRVGRGGMAEILLARERSPAGGSRHLVIKRVLPEIADSGEMLDMFLAEARVVMGLAHPNLCQIYEVGEQEGTFFIAMEWVNGATLHQLIRRAQSEGELDHSVVSKVVALCAEALHHAHTARDNDGRPLHLVHRDVSPHNIMVAFDGRVKLLDFGIAKSTKSTFQTEAGVVKGKVCYMAPEQWLCSPLDARTDVFALGACLYEALTGRVVFKRDTQSEVMRAVLKEGAPPLSQVAPEVPPELARIVHRALAFDANQRFQTALEMSEALEHYLASLSSPLPSAKIAAYVRRLFRAEVELGPLLERTVRAAHLPAMPALLLPPLPPSLLGVPKLDPPLITGSDPTQFEPTALPPAAATANVLPAHLQPSRSVPPFPDPFGEELDAQDLTQSTERPLSRPPEEEASAPLALLTSVETETTAPEPDTAITGEARPAVRTVSMHARRGRRALLIALPAAALLALGLSLSSATKNQPQRSSVHLANSAAKATHEAPAPAAMSAAPIVAVAPAALPIDRQEAEPRKTKSDQLHGRLSINTRPWSTVYLGQRVLGTTPLASVPVPRGTLMLKLVDRDGNVHLRKVARSRKIERSAFYDFEAAAQKPARKR